MIKSAMKSHLTQDQLAKYEEFQQFAKAKVEPFAAEWDHAQQIPGDALSCLGRAGYLGACIPADFGGQGWDTMTFGLLNEALGRSDSAFTGVVTVQSMVSMSLLKWGTDAQRQKWLPPLAKGEMYGAFALTEPDTGSDLQSLTTAYHRDDGKDGLVLSGEKKWITCGQFADVFLVFGKLDQKPLACLVPKDSDGLKIEPIRDLMGFRAAGLARLHFSNVAVPADNIIGKPGFAFSHVAPVGLQYGRISTACSALGLLRGCFEESTAYAASRKIGEKRVGDLGMIQSLIARMGADLEAARLLCWSACRAEDASHRHVLFGLPWKRAHQQSEHDRDVAGGEEDGRQSTCGKYRAVARRHEQRRSDSGWQGEGWHVDRGHRRVERGQRAAGLRTRRRARLGRERQAPADPAGRAATAAASTQPKSRVRCAAAVLNGSSISA